MPVGMSKIRCSSKKSFLGFVFLMAFIMYLPCFVVIYRLILVILLPIVKE
jgi:hypothetical protein